MTRYHPFLVVLHWLLAALIVIALLGGHFSLAATPNTDPGKIQILQMHMSFGFAILFLMLVRLVVRVRSQKPPHADTGNAMLNTVGQVAHWLFYALVIGMAASGIATARLAGLPDIVFGGSGEPLPADFFEFAPRIAHGIISKILGALILLHIAGVVYHQFSLKDRLLSRMWFGNRQG